MDATRTYLEKAHAQLREMSQKVIFLQGDAKLLAEDALAQFSLALSMLEAELMERRAPPRFAPRQSVIARDLVASFLPPARRRLHHFSAAAAWDVPPAAQPLLDQVCGDLAMALEVFEVLQRELGGPGAVPVPDTEIVSILQADGTIEYESESVTQVLGYGPSELLGLQAFDLVHPEDSPCLRDHFAAGLERPGAVFMATYRFRHRDGRWLRLHSIGQNVVQNTRVAGYVVRSYVAREVGSGGALVIPPRLDA